MWVHIQASNGILKQYTSFNATHRLIDLKNWVYVEFACTNISVIYNGNILDTDEMTLCTCGIFSESVVYVIINPPIPNKKLSEIKTTTKSYTANIKTLDGAVKRYEYNQYSVLSNLRQFILIEFNYNDCNIIYCGNTLDGDDLLLSTFGFEHETTIHIVNKQTKPCNLPTEIGNLVKLKILSINKPNLKCIIPTEIGKLADLTVINLSNSNLTGRIPTEIGNLVKLKKLLFANNELTGIIPTEIGKLTNLIELQMHVNKLNIAKIPTEIGKLINLEQLFI